MEIKTSMNRAFVAASRQSAALGHAPNSAPPPLRPLKFEIPNLQSPRAPSAPSAVCHLLLPIGYRPLPIPAPSA